MEVEKREVGELTDIEVQEVSFVGRPANQRKFVLYKNEEGGDTMAEDEAKVEEVVEPEVEKALSEHDKNAAEGAIKILRKRSTFASVVDSLRKLVGGTTEKEAELEEEVKSEEEVTKTEAIEKERDAAIAKAAEEKARADEAEAKLAEAKKAERKGELETIAKDMDGEPEKVLDYLTKMEGKGNPVPGRRRTRQDPPTKGDGSQHTDKRK